MTEAEWLACEDPVTMLAHLDRPSPDRKVRLYAVACCRNLWDMLPGQASRDGVEWAERFADGKVKRDEEYDRLNWASEADYLRHTYRLIGDAEVSEEEKYKLFRAAFFAFFVMWYENCFPDYSNFERHREHLSVRSVHDIFGNPFRPVTLDPSWLTSTVLTIASDIYEEKAFDQMPILADALQDAGCDNEEILRHCRGPGPHTRGCWVVDLVLGRK